MLIKDVLWNVGFNYKNKKKMLSVYSFIIFTARNQFYFTAMFGFSFTTAQFDSNMLVLREICGFLTLSFNKTDIL